MKKLVIILLLLTGCGYLPKPQTQVQTHTTAQIANTTQRLETIGALSVGIDATIPKQPDIALDLNKKVQTLAEQPTPAQVKQVMDSITNQDARTALESRLEALIIEKRKISDQSTQIINNLSNANAELEEAKQQAEEDLADLKHPTTAIWYGVSTIIKRFFYSIVGFSIVFLLLRIFASSSPLVGSIFSIFEHSLAFVLKGLSQLFPRLLEFAGTTSTKLFVQHDSTLQKIVSSIETLKDSGDKNITLDDLLDELSRRLDTDEKKIVADIKLKII